MPTYKKRFNLIAAVVGLAGLAGALALLLCLQAFKPRVEAAASAALGMEVRVGGRLGLTLWPGLGISLRGVSVSSRGSEIFAAQKVKLTARLLPLLAKLQLRPSSVTVISPVFSIIRNAQGTFNFAGTEKADAGGSFSIKSVSISKGKLAYLDEKSGRRIEAAGIGVELKDFSYSGADPARPLKGVSYSAVLTCKTLAAGGSTFRNLAVVSKGENGVFDISPDRGNFFGGSGKGNLRADFSGPRAGYRLTAELNRFRIEELVRAVSPGAPSHKIVKGTASFSADLTASGDSADALMRSLEGGLSLSGADLMFYGLDIDELIPKYERSQNFNLVDVGAFLLAGPFGPALTKSYNFGSLYEESRGGQGLIRKFVSVWKVGNGIAQAVDVALTSDKNRLAMKGGLDFNTGRFSGVTVAVLNKRGCAVYRQEVRGPFRSPRLGKVGMLRSLTGSVSSALEDVWGLVQGCRVFYAGSVPQPEKAN